MSMFSNTLTHQSLGYPFTGAWTTILVWSTAGGVHRLPPGFSGTRPEREQSVGGRLGDTFGDSVTVSAFEEASGATHPARRDPES